MKIKCKLGRQNIVKTIWRICITKCKAVWLIPDIKSSSEEGLRSLSSMPPHVIESEELKKNNIYILKKIKQKSNWINN